MSACLDDSALLELVEGRLDPERAPAVHAHLDLCASCRELVAESAKYCFQEDDAPADEVSTEATLPARARRARPEPTVQPGRTIGRYVIGEVIGAGGMAVVYRAHDPQLGRHVALKLVRTDRRAAHDWQLRLLREARAMAQLSHPNVVHVYDAGVVDDQVFLAMELVEGQTLDQWMRAAARTPTEILSAFIESGRGLAAAHAANLVHRDFKPSNVLVSHDGRVRVTDFGLARSALSSPQEGLEAPPAELLPSVTRTGMVVGTPAYMAPEQLRGLPTDGRTDQFGFCVALFEFLYGERPSIETTSVPAAPPEATAISLPLRQRALGSPVPGVYRVLERGLRLDPGERYPSMEALLGELAAVGRARVPARSRRILLAAVGGLVGVAAVAGFAGLALWPEKDAPGTAAPPAAALAQPAAPAAPATIAPAAPPVAAPASDAPSRVAARPVRRKPPAVTRTSAVQKPSPRKPDADALKPFAD